MTAALGRRETPHRSAYTCCLSSSHGQDAQREEYAGVLAAFCLRGIGSHKGKYQEQRVKLEPDIIPRRLSVVR